MSDSWRELKTKCIISNGVISGTQLQHKCCLVSISRRRKTKATQPHQILITSGSNRYHLNRYQCPIEIESNRESKKKARVNKRNSENGNKRNKKREHSSHGLATSNLSTLNRCANDKQTPEYPFNRFDRLFVNIYRNRCSFGRFRSNDL